MKRLLYIGLLAAILLPLSALAFSSDLYYGVRKSADVTELQEFLTDQGIYSGPITGNFFSLTLKAVKNFQTANGINSTGYFGPLSRARANSLLAEQGVGQTLTDESGASTTPTIIPPKTNDDVVIELKKQNDLLTQQNQALQNQQQILGAIQTNTMPVSVPAPVVIPEVKKELVIYADPIAGSFTKSVSIYARYSENGKPVPTNITFSAPSKSETYKVVPAPKECEPIITYPFLIQRSDAVGSAGNCSKDGTVQYNSNLGVGTTTFTASANGLSKSIDVFLPSQ